MSIDVNQLRDYVIVPALTAVGMWSPAAVKLLLATSAQETNLGSFIVQSNIGLRGGLGIYQLEKNAFQDIWDRTVDKNIALKSKIKLYCGYEGRPFAERIITDLALATIMTRLFYYQINSPLPNVEDIEGMARYWKKWYNTEYGSGTIEQFIENYNRYCV